MEHKHRANRSDYNDSTIMDALDVSDYNINQAAGILGVPSNTLRNWIIKSDNLTSYIRYKQAEGAFKAREKLEYMLDHMDCLDPKQASTVLGVCKTLMDKYEPDLTKSEVKAEVEVDKALQDKINKLLGN